jgi:hypothetical protein
VAEGTPAEIKRQGASQGLEDAFLAITGNPNVAEEVA